MKPNFRKTKVDANQKEIVDYLRRHGIYVKVLSSAGEITDLLLWNGEYLFLEIKAGNKDDRWTRMQLNFISEQKGKVGIARTKEEALAFAKNPQKFGLTQRQKNKIAIFLALHQRDKTRFTPKEVEDLFEKDAPKPVLKLV